MQISLSSVVNPMDIGRLEPGMSLCCQSPLAWSSHRIAGIFVSVEQLLDPHLPLSAHPSLLFGQVGIRALLALLE
jgi:hypothetical protein